MMAEANRWSAAGVRPTHSFAEQKVIPGVREQLPAGRDLDTEAPSRGPQRALDIAK
jgi:hypothetical protein